MKEAGKKILITLVVLLACAGIFLSFPKILALSIEWRQSYASSEEPKEFPVTVDPRRKLIVENEQVNAYLADKHSLFGAAIAGSGNIFWDAFQTVAVDISQLPWYQALGSVGGRFVTVAPGLRKEQVANAFASVLGWNEKQKKDLVTAPRGSELPLPEGSFAAGTYLVSLATTPAEAQAMMNEKFKEDILSHYGTSTEAAVPLKQALIIASLIQRETITNDGMRLLSGIIWNRIFAGMNLQIDSTLQYTKANKLATGRWWPSVASADKYLKSPYNTYLNKGLPPGPIASPSVAAVLAALNPIKTDCLFYFNDKKGDFHCSATYAEHLKLLQEYY